MKIGIVSDTHDRDLTMMTGLNLLTDAGVEYLIHCGDWTKPQTLHTVATYAVDHDMPLAGVFGNRDDYAELTEAANLSKNLIIPEDREVLRLELGGRRFLVYHGHNKKRLADLLAEDSYDVFLTGHTHKPLIESNGDRLVVNPGSTAFLIPRKREPRTVAIYDTMSRSAELLHFE